MKREKEIAKVKFREFLHVHNATDDDIDIDYIDVNDFINDLL